jgi:inorganic pyrophosphatase
MGHWIEKPHPHSSEPWPASYGYIPETHNPADGDELDILVLATEPLETGSRVQARPVGLLLRPDGDDKVIGVLVGDPDFGDISRFQDIPSRETQSIEDWFAAWSQVGQWRDEAMAIARIKKAWESQM